MWLAYYQGQIFQKFREKERFVSDMVLKFSVNKSTTVFKIPLKKLIDDFPRIKNSSLALYYIEKKKKKKLKLIKKICKENSSEFK